VVAAHDLALGRSLLGAALAAQDRFTEAEPLLLQGYEENEPDPSEPRERVDALRRIIAGYDAWHTVEPGAGHDGQAREWRAKLDAATRH